MRRPGTYPKRWLPRSPSALVLALGVVWVILLGAGALGAAEASTFAALGAVAVITTITGLRWYRPALRWPWWCICAALVLFLIGGAVREQLGTLGDLSSHRSLIPDAITIPGYVILAVALAAFGHARRRGRAGDVDAILDATVAALAALSLAWVFLIGPVVHGDVTTLSVEVVVAVYPALSVFLVALCARIAFSPQSRRVVAYQLVFAAMGMPTKPLWALNDGIFWAPTVAKVGSTYVAFFAANRPNAPQPWNSQCIGRATSLSPTGPFVPELIPFTCGLGGKGGALDPSLFQDPRDGRWYLLAAFGDTDAPIRILGLDANLNAPRDQFGLAYAYDWAVYGRRYACGRPVTTSQSSGSVSRARANRIWTVAALCSYAASHKPDTHIPSKPPAIAVPGSPGKPPLPVAACNRKPSSTVLARRNALKMFDNRSDS